MWEDILVSVIGAKGCESLLQGMKFLHKIKWLSSHLTSGAWIYIGPIDPPSNQKKYIIVCTDYLTKWVETKAIKAVTEEKVAEFLRKNVVYKFGYPRELVTDQGNKFTSNMIEHC